MAIDPSIEYPGKITAPNGDYDYGSAKSASTPTAPDGTPFSIKMLNDIFGFQQAVLNVNSIVPSGDSETQLVSQYLQGISEMITNQDYGADASNTDNYEVSTKSRALSYQEGLYFLKVTNTNTGAATVDYNSLGAKSIKRPGGEALLAGDLPPSKVISLIYNGTEFRLLTLGRVVQTVFTQTGAVATGTTQLADDDGIPEITEGDEYMTRTITPLSTNHKLKIYVCVHMAHNQDNQNQVACLFRDSVTLALACGFESEDVASRLHQISFMHNMDAPSISEITFRVRAGCSAVGTTTFNGIGGVRKYGGVLASSIVIIETET
ncbi:hypothetical protein KAR10_02815 [bacterium]|nr:hypothetical protein [bacterium]